MEIIEKQEKRLEGIDIAKGIGILLVIIGHSGLVFGEGLFKLIYGFHMPLFFLISGYLFHFEKWKEKGFSSFLKNKFCCYILPYFELVFINFVIEMLRHAHTMGINRELVKTGCKYIYYSILSYASTSKMPNCSPLWYLTAIFIAYIYLYALLSLRKKSYMQIAFFVLMFGGGWTFTYVNTQLPWHFDSALIGCIFMGIGYTIREKQLLEKLEPTALALMAICGFLYIYHNDQVSLISTQLGNLYLFYPGAILVSTSLLAVCIKYLHSSFLAFLGKNTILIMGFNYAFMDLYKFFWKSIGFTLDRTWYFAAAFVFIVSVLAILCWNWLKERFPVLKKLRI